MFLHVSPFFPFDYAFSGKPIRKHTSTYDDINAQICLTENGKNTRTKRKYLQKETKDSNKIQKQESKRSDTVFPSLQPSQNLRSFSPSHGLVQKKYKPLNARVNLLKWRCNKPCLRKTTHSGSTPDRVEKQSLTVTEYLPQLPGSYLRSNKSQSIFSQIFSLHFPSIFCESSILSPCLPVGRGRAHLQQNNRKMRVIWILSFRSQHFLPRYFQFDHSHQDFPSLDPEFQSLSPQ